MLYQFLTLMWTVFDEVFEWFIDIYNSLDVNFTSLVLAALAFSSFIGYVISPYVSNPLRSADQERDRRRADQERVRRRSRGNKR